MTTNNYLTFIKLGGLFKIFSIVGQGYGDDFCSFNGNGGSEFENDGFGDAFSSDCFEGKGDGQLWAETRSPSDWFKKGTEASWRAEYSVCPNNGELNLDGTDD
jgi:hypothetical protein